jgi:asparagine synthase (glutamine-hydrolysing)
MCGLVAIFQDDPIVDLSTARRAVKALAHRGPDAAGEWRDGNVFLGHRRLSIIDLDTGGQPMLSADERFVIVFNGEIYNFPELRDILSGKGATFRTHSDTEVILEGFRYWGPEVVQHLNGMFAFVILDRFNRTIFGARDRLGIKPLCWARNEDGLIVSSTLEPLSLLGFDTLDPEGLRDLMVFDYVPAPRTILRNVRKLEPGNRFQWQPGDSEPRIERYWSPPLAAATLVAPEEDELEELLDRAVARQMISDVPIGVFLSGGIDSSLLVAFMARHSDRPVRTFSVAFDEGDMDESSIAGLVAGRFNTDHTVLRAEEIGASALLELIGRLDEPLCDPAIVPTYALSKITKQHVKVALSGDGGDEVFGGYPKYLLGENAYLHLPVSSWFDPLLRAVPWRPNVLRRVYWRTLSSADRIRFSWSRYGDFPVFLKDLRQLLSRDYHEAAKIEHYFAPWELRARRYGESFGMDVLMRADLETYLSENCLVKTDRASMLASLEVRVPYLDEMVLQRILPLTAEEKIHNGRLKSLLIPIARRLLPREVWDRPKHGFAVPLQIRLGGAWRPAVKTALEWGESNLDVFDYSYLWENYRMNNAGKDGTGDMARKLWNPFLVLAWAMGRGLNT